MKKRVKNLIKKAVQGKHASPKAYVKYLRDAGCTIGERTVFFEPKTTQVDVTRPWLIEIGNDVKITKGVTILTHGYDWAVLRNVYHEMIGSSGKVKIGNNVFVGVNTTILKGVTIGDNVVIGANSLVNKDIPDNVVAVGNPVRVVMTIDEYYQKRLSEYMNEAKELAVEYFKKHSEIPPIGVFREFYPLFLERDLEIAESHNLPFFKMEGANPEDLEKNFMNTEPHFKGYNDFLKWCGIV